MDETVLIVAIGCSRLTRILEIAAGHGFVVFGMMRGHILAGLNNCLVYLYETG